MSDEDFPMRKNNAYHEAGHAVAAIKTPGGRVNEIDICDRDVHNENGYTHNFHVDADDAFVLYAGPWAEATFAIWPSETIDLDRVLATLRFNTSDWMAFQRAAGRRIDDVSEAELQDALASGGVMPAEYRPNWAWHEKAVGVVEAARFEIEELARKLIARDPEIVLRNGQRLVREKARDRWRSTDFPEGGDDGIVGPPPPVQLSDASGSAIASPEGLTD